MAYLGEPLASDNCESGDMSMVKFPKEIIVASFPYRVFSCPCCSSGARVDVFNEKKRGLVNWDFWDAFLPRDLFWYVDLCIMGFNGHHQGIVHFDSIFCYPLHNCIIELQIHMQLEIYNMPVLAFM